MASVKKRPDGMYRARYRDPEGKEHSAHFRRKLDADNWLDKKRGELVEGRWVDPNAGRKKFSAYAAEWQAIQVHRPTTEAQVASNLKNHVLPILGDRPIGSIRTSEIQAWAKGRGEVLAPSTVEVIYNHLRAIFRAAVADKVIAESPCTDKVKLPRRERRKVEPMAVETVQAITEAVPSRYRALVMLAAGTGLRQGEAFGLTVDRVDFLRRTVKVDRQLILLPGAGPEFGPPKTDASYRTVPLPQVVVDELAAHLARWPAGESGLIFTNDQGEPIRRTRFSDVWRSAVKATKVDGAKFHDLRHFYASLLIRHGESVKVVQSRLGHASAAETLDTYSHLWPDSEDQTRAAVDLVLGAPSAGLTRGAHGQG